jgi:hypothetical protein
MTQRLNFPGRSSLLAVTLLAGLPALAATETSPYYFGVSQAVTGDWNVFRRPDGEPQPRDVISSTGLLAGIDQPFGRLRLGASAAVNANRFKNNKQLNNTDHDTRLQLDWSSIERLSGDVVVYDRSSLNRYDLSSAEGTQSEKDMLRVTGGAVRARVGLVTLWSLDGGYSYEQSEHSLDTLSNRDVRQGAVNAGVRLSPSDLWSARLGVRRTDGKYPNFRGTGGQEADEFTRDDIDLSLNWKPTGNSKFDARLSSTREEHNIQGQRDSRYFTGLLGYDWILTGKTRLRLQASRDTGAGRSDSDLALLTESSDTQVRNSVAARVTWDATSKITVNAGVNYSRRKLDNAFTLSDGTTSTTDARTARDRTTIMNLSVYYQALRSLKLGCRVSHEDRSVQGDNVNTTYPYDATVSTCNLEWVFR